MSLAKRVLVLDGRSIATVAIVRSLGKKGIRVTCGEEFKNSPGALSKYVDRKVVYPSPSKMPDLFMEKMISLLKNGEYELLLPVSDMTSMMVSKNKDELSRYTRVPTPDLETLMKARDKSRTMKFALENAIPCPKTYFPEETSIEEIKKTVKYPVVIKPCESSGARGIRYADSPETLGNEFEKLKQSYDKVIIQEFIPSSEGRYLLHTIFETDHKPIAACVLQAIRCYPDNGGPTAFGKTVFRPEITDYGLRLLEAMKWQGVAEAEFLIDERDGKPKLMEVNPRFGNPVGLVIEAGIDIPGKLYEMMVNGRTEMALKYKIGVKWRWFFPQDFLWLFTAKHRAGRMGSFWRFFDNDLHYADISFSDLGPSLGLFLQSLRFLVKREKRDFIFNRGW
jgi:predicted ATP-grasp superfamily ATP-dependent carboligase